MKTFKAKRGPFAEQPYYEAREVDAMCVAELIQYGLYPSQPEPIRIERFIEKRFNLTVEYDDLPAGILGLSQFNQQGVERIIVARSLDEDESKPAQRRLRTTLAHEAGHSLLHAHLFALSMQPKLFGNANDADQSKVLCREVPDEAHHKKPVHKSDWWEVQANMAMSALLLPKPLVSIALQSFLTPSGSFGLPQIMDLRRGEAISSLAELFDVNPIVARIRIDAVYPVASSQQLRL